MLAGLAKAFAHGERQKAPNRDHRPRDLERPILPEKKSAQDEHGKSLTSWHFTEAPPNKKKKLFCSCKGNCQLGCPGRSRFCPNAPDINLPGRRSDVLGLPSRDTDTETQRDRHTDTDTQPHRHTDIVTQRQTQAHRNPDDWVANQASPIGKKIQLKKVWRPLCTACKCRIIGCRRKPHGNHVLLSNVGLCQKHWNMQ